MGAGDRGGSSGLTKTEKISVYPGEDIDVSIGAITTDWNTGPSTIVGGISAIGGTPGPIWCYPKLGGSGGGGRGGAWAFNVGKAGKGGSDGSDGEGGWTYWVSDGSLQTDGVGGGKGQGTTTRAFGDPEGTLYAGGGGGWFDSSGWFAGDVNVGASGGAGGGGNGGANRSNGGVTGTDGMLNTGGGGGGNGGKGGSGIAIIRWGH